MSNGILNLLLEIFGVKKLEKLDDEDMTLRTRKAAGLLIDLLSLPDSIATVRQELLSNDLKRVIRNVNEEAKPELLVINTSISEKYQEYLDPNQSSQVESVHQ